jgi:hypothetical protein
MARPEITAAKAAILAVAIGDQQTHFEPDGPDLGLHLLVGSPQTYRERHVAVRKFRRARRLTRAGPYKGLTYTDEQAAELQGNVLAIVVLLRARHRFVADVCAARLRKRGWPNGVVANLLVFAEWHADGWLTKWTAGSAEAELQELSAEASAALAVN